jgi:LysM repeat protein
MSFAVSSSSSVAGARSQFAGTRLSNTHGGRTTAAVAPGAAKKSHSRSLRVTAAMRPYTVRKGDSLKTIASKRGMSVEEIRKCNAGRVMDTEVRVGETILLPAGKLSKRDGQIIDGKGRGALPIVLTKDESPLFHKSLPPIQSYLFKATHSIGAPSVTRLRRTQPHQPPP